jgi:O-antigen/teichoic acid export membrane protein
MVSGTVLAQFVSIATAPLLTRIYTPHDYGVLGIFLGVSAIFNIVSTFNFPVAIFIPQDMEEVKKLFQLSIFIVSVVSVLSLLVVLLLGSGISSLFNLPELSHWLYFIPPVLFFYGTQFILFVYLNRLKQYRAISVSKVVAAFSSVLVSVGLGLLYGGPLGLILGTFFNYAVVSVLMMIYLLREEKRLFSDLIDFGQMKYYFKQYRNFPLYTLPSDFINIFVNQLPVFVLGTASPQKVGHFNISNRILATPVQFVSVSISDILRQKLSEEMHSNRDCSSTYRSMFRPLLLFIVPFMLLFFFAPDIFAFVFGESWRPAGYFTQLMTPYFLLKFLAVPFVPVYSLAMRQREEFLLHLYLLVSTLLLVGFSVYFKHDTDRMILLFSVNYAVVYIFYLLRTYRFSHKLGRGD